MGTYWGELLSGEEDRVGDAINDDTTHTLMVLRFSMLYSTSDMY